MISPRYILGRRSLGLFLVGIFLLLFFGIHSARAARIVLQPHDSANNQIDVLIDPQGQEINGLEGDVALQGSTSNVRVSDANSIVPFWIEAPVLQNGVIHYSGIIPAGFSGLLVPDVAGTNPALLFSIVFDSSAQARVGAVARNSSVFLNDGLGTQIALPLAHVDFFPNSGPSPAATSSDSISPSSFAPVIGSDPSIFSGHWFVAWNTLDHGSGIDHYEVAEYRPGEAPVWIQAESPYELRDQELKSAIEVRAIDKAGNQRIGHLDAPHPITWQDWLPLRGILWVLLIVGATATILWRRIRKS